ncbi:MAG: C10 family peptidase [Bacteroidaceae bacterium]|nr:C10 family peptidase [Bacteroidaceae bacterium]
MKRILTIILVLHLGLYGVAQTELTRAKSWLVNHGTKSSRLELKMTEEYDELVVLEDATNRAFAIVAKDEYASLLENPILAYSIDNVFSNPEGGWSRNLITSYREQLCTLLSGVSSVSMPSYVSVRPLLGATRWGQKYPYNIMCPESPLVNGNKLVGCVAVAMSQIMFYHKYPSVGKKSFSYMWNGQSMSCDFSEYVPCWTSMKPAYSSVKKKQEDASSVAKLTSMCAFSVASDFQDLETSASVAHARSAFVNFWGYSPSCLYNSNVTPGEISSIVVNELENRRPVILTGGGHAFVCDGSNGPYLHFNLGWNGAGNGYYMFSLFPYWECSSVPYVANSILYGIRPCSEDYYVNKTVSVVSPGTLPELIGVAKMDKIKKLVITGKLNGRDVAFLRRMLGATDKNEINVGWKIGVLTSLDISSADFVSDGKNAYCRMSADGCSYTMGNTVYDFTNMTEDNFSKFRRTNAFKGTGYKFAESGGKYYVDFYTVSHAVSPMMFSDCQNLRELRLSNKVTKILGRAFSNCSSLQYITLPLSVSEVETGAFTQCFMLRRVYTYNDELREVVHGLSPVKILGKYGDETGNVHHGILDGNDIVTCDGVYLRNGSKAVKFTKLGYKEYTK